MGPDVENPRLTRTFRLAPKPGRFITFEGIDGSGKTTQLRLVDEKLKELGIKTLLTREPGGCPTGETIRTFAFANKVDSLLDMCMMYTARMFHLRQTIKPALDEGIWVLCDRFVSSTWAYQVDIPGIAPGVQPHILQLTEEALFNSGFPKPDLELFLTLDKGTSEKRRRARVSSDRFEDTLDKVIAGYAYRYANHPPSYSVAKVDATESLSTVTDRIVAAITDHFSDVFVS